MQTFVPHCQVSSKQHEAQLLYRFLLYITQRIKLYERMNDHWVDDTQSSLVPLDRRKGFIHA